MIFGVTCGSLKLSTLQALLRRCSALLCSFFYDNATLQDWESTAVSSQELVEQVMRLLGYPFATAKRQGPSVSGDFLGLVHDFSATLDEQRIHAWIQIQDLITFLLLS